MLEIMKTIGINVSLLVLVAYLLTKIEPIKEIISTDTPSFGTRIFLAVVFGFIGILSTYTGVEVQGAIANTRVIGILAGGILGGPVVGIGAGLIAGFHRWASDIGGFTAVACGISTVAEGLIGGLFWRVLQKHKKSKPLVFGVVVLAEILQMAIILLVARPLQAAWHLVQVISIPMILVNSLGVVIFVSVFDSVFLERDREAGNRVRLVLSIAEQCLPYLRRGLYNKDSLTAAADVVCQNLDAAGVAITDGERFLRWVGKDAPSPEALENIPLPQLVRQVLESGEVLLAETAAPEDTFYEVMQHSAAVCAPLTRQGKVIGAFVTFVQKFKLGREAELETVGGLAKLFSTQLELSEVEYQKKLLQKAEFTALQSQVNPHFLFNALSTITAFCREKPERARELLIVLSSYFRNTLRANRYIIPLQDELEHVNAYLELEKARFEEKLLIRQDVPAELLGSVVPAFILQPIVENAVKHGAMRGTGAGEVSIAARSSPEGGFTITVQDNGPGIPPEIVEQLYQDRLEPGRVGLRNVHKRLLSIYGPENGLLVDGRGPGTRVTIRIPFDASPQ